MHRIPAFLLFLLCCSSVLPKGTESVQSVHITALINPGTRIGREQKIAIQIAAHEFNASVCNLFLNIININKEEDVKDWRGDAIIATGPWMEVVHVAEKSNKERIPILSLTTAPPLTHAPNPFLFWMTYSTSSYMHCLADLVKSYNWRRVIVLYEEDNYGSISGSMIPLLSNALKAIGSDIDYQASFPPLDSLSKPNTMLHQKLERINRRLCKVFIVLRWSSPSLALDLFKEAKALGMMDKGSVWITGDDITTLVDSAFTPSFVSSYMQGVIGIRNYFNKSRKSYSDFHVQFQQNFKSEYNEIRETNFEPGMYALRAYDAVDVIAHAMAGAVDKNEGLLEGIQSANFLGLTGPLRFKKDGGLMDVKGSAAFQLINFVGQSYREMGFWVKGFGFFEGVLAMERVRPVADSLDVVYWPGGPKKKIPGGWRTLRIGVPARTQLDKFVKVEYDDKGKVKKVTGFCIDVFQEALQSLKYHLSYEFFPFSGPYDDLVAGIPKVYDAVVGDITILAKRLENASFTEPFLPSGLSMMVRVKPDHTTWMLAKPFSSGVWYLVAATLIYTGLIVWYLEQKRNPEFNGPWWTQFGATFWLISSTIFFKHGKVHSYYTKVVMVAWLVVVLVLTNTYTASLSSILTSQKLDPVRKDGKVGCDGDSFILTYLQEVLGYNDQKIEKIKEEDNYPKAFDSGKITAAYFEVPYLRVFLAQHKGYAPYGEIHRLGGFGFAFAKDSPLTTDFSQAILTLSENGALKKLEDKWFSVSLTNCPITPDNGKSDSLTLDSFWTLFAFTGVTTTIIFILFKARLLSGYSCRICSKLCLSLRERCMKLFESKLRSRKKCLLSQRPSIPSPQIAPEPRQENLVLAENHHPDGEIEVVGLPDQNNV